MASDTLSSAANFLKTYYRDFAHSDLQMASKVVAAITKKAKRITIGGASLNATWEAQYSDGVGEGVLSEGGAFPTAQASAAQNPALGIVHRCYSVGITGHLLSAGNTDTAAFPNARNFTKKKNDELMNRIKLRIAKEMMWNGSFILCQVGTVSSTASKNYFTIKSGGCPINMFTEGDLLTIRDAATGGSATASPRVVGVDQAQGRVYVDNIGSAVADNYVSLSAYYDQTVMNGLRNLVDNDNTVQGIDRTLAVSTWMRCSVLDNSGAAIGPSFVDSVRDTALNQNYAREGVRVMWGCNRKTRRWAALSTIGQVRFAAVSEQQLGTPSLDIGTADGVQTLVEDELFMDSELYAVDPSSFIVAHPEGQEGPQLVNVGGSVILQKVGSSGYYDEKQILATWRGNMGIDVARPNVRGENFVSP